VLQSISTPSISRRSNSIALAVKRRLSAVSRVGEVVRPRPAADRDQDLQVWMLAPQICEQRRGGDAENGRDRDGERKRETR
jgi:hypothetical protein